MNKIFLTNDKHYMSELTMKELLDEYTAVTKKFGQVFEVYLSIPKESSKKSEYENEMTMWYDEKNKFAVAIADSLTK